MDNANARYKFVSMHSCKFAMLVSIIIIIGPNIYKLRKAEFIMMRRSSPLFGRVGGEAHVFLL